MYIFDTHNHIWKCSGKHFEWITDSMHVIKRDFLIGDLLKVLKENGVTHNILVQATPEIDETKTLLDIADKHQMVAGVIGWVDIPKGVNIASDLTIFKAQSQKLSGIRYMSQGLNPNHLIAKNFIDGVKTVAKFGLIYELLVDRHQLDHVSELVSLCPDVFFILNHMGKPNIKSQEIKHWHTSIEQISSFKNVYCKLSGMVTEANIDTWRPCDIYPYIEVIMQNFGDDRVLYGSDYPVCLLAASYKETLNVILSWFNKHPRFSLEKVLFKNAENIYLKKNYQHLIVI